MILLGKLIYFIEDNIESILVIVPLIFTLALISAYVSLIVIGIKGLVIDIKDYKRLKPQFKELEKSLEEETDTTELLPLQKGKPIFESFVSKFDDCEGTDFDKSSATFKAMNLFNKMKKLRDNVQKNVLDMQEMKYDVSPSFIPVYNTQLRLLNCYNTLMSYQPETLDDIDKIEWIFNKGALRTEEEITEMKQYVSAMKFRNEEKLSWDMDLEMLSGISVDSGYQIALMICIIISNFVGIMFFLDSGLPSDFEDFTECAGMFSLGMLLAFILSYLPAIAICGGIGFLRSDVSEQKWILSQKAMTQPPNFTYKPKVVTGIIATLIAASKLKKKDK